MNPCSETPPRIRIKGGRLVDPANRIDGEQDLYLADRKVVGIGTAPDGFQVEQEIDARGQVVCPGLIDLAVRLREPGQEHKATIDSECRAAASAGITTLCCPPDTDPVIDTPAVVELIHHRARQTNTTRVLTLGALTRDLDGKLLSEMRALQLAGCVGVTNILRPLANSLVERRAFEYAATFDLTVHLHANDESLSNGGCAHEGAVATRLGLPGIPAATETASVARLLALIEQTGVRAHFCRITSGRALGMIGRARHDGLPVSADVAVPYLFLTELDIAEFDSQCHVLPPLRAQEDRDALRAGLARGSLTALCSDHQPHEDDAKRAPFPSTAPGISGLDTLLPMALRLVEQRVMALGDVLHRLTAGPAAILGLEQGQLAIGAPADVCIFDPEHTWILDDRSMESGGHNSPFRDWEMKGRASHTLLNGRVVYSREGL
ncbi:MAG TPA: dihydroorotase [Gammaproteobacteria bacterium]|nr:dihydroorotase [Gammaproteobacteria bacterium]